MYETTVYWGCYRPSFQRAFAAPNCTPWQILGPTFRGPIALYSRPTTQSQVDPGMGSQQGLVITARSSLSASDTGASYLLNP